VPYQMKKVFISSVISGSERIFDFEEYRLIANSAETEPTQPKAHHFNLHPSLLLSYFYRNFIEVEPRQFSR